MVINIFLLFTCLLFVLVFNVGIKDVSLRLMRVTTHSWYILISGIQDSMNGISLQQRK